LECNAFKYWPIRDIRYVPIVYLTALIGALIGALQKLSYHYKDYLKS